MRPAPVVVSSTHRCAPHDQPVTAAGAGCRACDDGVHVALQRVGHPRSDDLVAWVQPVGESPVRVRYRPLRHNSPHARPLPWRCDEHGDQTHPTCVHTIAAARADRDTPPAEMRTA